MSLILEALKKLEREKQVPDKGFLVVAHVPWATGTPRGPRALMALGVVLGVGAAAAGLWLVRRGAAVAREAPSAAPAAASAPATTSVPPTPAVLPPGSPDPTLPGASPLPLPSRFEAPRQPHPRAAPPSSAAVRPASPRPAALPHASPTPAAPEVELRLNAISAQDGRPVAILNDRLVREGDVFDGIRVLRIGEAEVEVEVRGRKLIVRF